MKRRIDGLQLRNFKGAAGQMDLVFDETKPITMIFGENGTGKSTIVDAIDFICNQKLGSIEDRSVGQTKASYLPTIGCSSSSLEVVMTSSGCSYKGTLGKTLKPSVSSSAEPVSAHVLRRNKILEIVNAQPRERYDAIKTFVDVPHCESNEDSLLKAVKECDLSVATAERDLSNAKDTLKKLSEREGIKGPDYIAWATERTSKDQSALAASLKDRNSLIELIEEGTRLKRTRQTFEESYSTDLEALRRIEQKYQEARSRASEDIASLIELLQRAQEYLKNTPNAQKCPVCEQRITPEALLLRIRERLKAMQSQIILKREVDEADRKAKDSERSFRTASNALVAHSIILRRAIINCTAVSTISVKTVAETLTSLVEGAETTWDAALPEAMTLVDECESVTEQLRMACSDDTEVLNQYNALKTHLETIDAKADKVALHRARLRVLSRMVPIVQQVRKQFIEDILGKISGDVERMYQIVHPCETIGKVQWFLDPKKRGSLEFKGQFQTRDGVPPPAYYSESHLDTLGICVFIALAQCDDSECPVLVLDDVLTSIDQTHLGRFLDMLSEEASRFSQVIITTHYRRWRDQYRYTGCEKGKVQLIELQRWSLKRGITHTKTKYIIDELEEQLTLIPFDRQLVASKAGVLLEAVLDRLCRQFQCRLPLKPDPDFTLSEYVGGLNKQLKKLLRVEKTQKDTSQQTITLSPLIDACTEQTWVRNQVGDHFNLSGMDASDDDVVDFGRRVIALASALSCDQCGQFPSRDKSGSYRECSCASLKLYPLQNVD